MAIILTQTSLAAFADAVLDKNGGSAKEGAEASFGSMMGTPTAPVMTLSR